MSFLVFQCAPRHTQIHTYTVFKSEISGGAAPIFADTPIFPATTQSRSTKPERGPPSLHDFNPARIAARAVTPGGAMIGGEVRGTIFPPSQPDTPRVADASAHAPRCIGSFVNQSCKPVLQTNLHRGACADIFKVRPRILSVCPDPRVQLTTTVPHSKRGCV